MRSTPRLKNIFSSADNERMKKLADMHESMRRLYEAIAVHLHKESPEAFIQEYGVQTTVAGMLSTSSGRINNLESENRGISKDLALKAQESYGINATWLLSGSGSMFIHADWPIPDIDEEMLRNLTVNEKKQIAAAIRAELRHIESTKAPYKRDATG